MEIKGVGVYKCLCAASSSRWSLFAELILNVCFIMISSSSSFDATREEAQPAPHLLFH